LTYWEERLRAVDNFMMRPTDVLRSYLAQDRTVDIGSFELGRIAMALEVVTVTRILEEYELLTENEQAIAMLQTLLIDQEISEAALNWYEMLSDWRKIKLADDGSDAYRRAVALGLVDHASAVPPDEPSDALPDNSQTTDPPSSG
jgi:hypothetical protein